MIASIQSMLISNYMVESSSSFKMAKKKTVLIADELVYIQMKYFQKVNLAAILENLLTREKRHRHQPSVLCCGNLSCVIY